MDYLKKKRKYFDSSKQPEHMINNINNNINGIKVNCNNNSDINFSQFYHSSKEKILYFSKEITPPKYFESSFENYPFYCSFNSFKNIREYNEDKILISCNKNKSNKFHLFSIFDGHNGEKCCNFLTNNFDKFLFSNKNLLDKPPKALRETYLQCEHKFLDLYKPKNLLMSIEKSGSCALCILVIGKKIYSANAGDSRALYSEHGSKNVYQISYEHKPQNELTRIRKAGYKIYSPFGGNVWRLFPGAIAVK